MRFMVMHKMTEEMESGLPPVPEVIAGVGKLIGESKKAGVFVSGEGLKPSSERLRITYQGGQRTITDGPFTEAKELVAGFALMKVRSREEAISWCDRFAAVSGDMELFLGPVVEWWDLGLGARPENAPLRFLALHRTDDIWENEQPLDPTLVMEMGAIVEEMTAAGVLQASGGLASTRRGARLRYQGGKATVIDGPFAESKELIAGYAIVELPSKASAIDWALRLGDVVKVNEIEIREMTDWETLQQPGPQGRAASPPAWVR